MCGLELAQALGVRRVRRLTVRDRKRRLPGARPQSKGRLQTRVAPFAQHRRAGEAVVGDPLPTQPRSVAGTEALDGAGLGWERIAEDRKSTRLNSSHTVI